MNELASEFSTLLHSLTCPEAFPFPVPHDAPITVIQTHASAVLLVQDRAYKLKKPHNFGFFDYSTAALRRHFCAQEVRLNSRLAPHVYLGVAPILASEDGRARFGVTLSPDALPDPGTSLDGARVIDYAVVMVRLPDEATLESRVAAGSTTPALLEEVAHHVAAFHMKARTDEHIASFGALEVITANWEENFQQMAPYVGQTLGSDMLERITDYVRGFLAARKPLLEDRVRSGYIRDCHGDLRLQHVYILDEAEPSTQRIAIVDCIEFNDRFRYGDVASEVAFLAMELDAAGRPDLSRVFVDAYVRETGDEALRELLPFYACYRACVRGKVLSFQLGELEVAAAQRERARHQAAALFELAAHYATGPARPVLALVGGLMGTGKSTLAFALEGELGWTLFSSDSIRKELAQVAPAQPQEAGFGQGLYSREWTVRTYRALLARAEAALAGGRSVLLDATFSRRADRQAAVHIGAAQGGRAVFIECVCPQEIALQRLGSRWSARARGEQVSRPGMASLASDGRPELYAAQRGAWEAFVASEEPGIKHVTIDTSAPFSVTVEQAREALDVPHRACFFQSG